MLGDLLDLRVGESAVSRRVPARRVKVRRCVDGDELRGVFDGEASQPQRVDQLEDGGVGADAQRERKHGHRCEAGIPAQLAGSIAKIAEQRFDGSGDVHVARALLLRRIVAEGARGGAARFVFRHAAGDQIVGALGNVKMQLVIELLGKLVAAEDIDDARE